MIEERLLYFETETLYNDFKNEINDEALSFVAQSGFEKLVIRERPFYFIPTNGVQGQILRYNSDGTFYWDDITSINLATNTESLTVSASTIIVKAGTNNEQIKPLEVKFTGDLRKGQEITIFLTKDRTRTYGYTIHMNEEEFYSFNNIYEFELKDNQWWKLVLTYDGTTKYAEVTQLDFQSDVVNRLETLEGVGTLFVKSTDGEEDGGKPSQNTIKANNGTTKARCNFETAIGRYNNDVRYSSDINNFGNMGNTLFAVGNGNSDSNRHNALEVRDDGSVYIADTSASGNYYAKPMLNVQEEIEKKANTDEVLLLTGGTVNGALTTISGGRKIEITDGQIKSYGGDPSESWANSLQFFEQDGTAIGAAVGCVHHTYSNKEPYYYYGGFSEESWNEATMFITQNQRVGIGTKEPTEKLDVVGNIKVSGHLFLNDADTLGYVDNNLSFGNTAIENLNTIVRGENVWLQNTVSSPDLVVKGNKVGIGTPTPTEKLEVVGNVKVSGNVTAANIPTFWTGTQAQFDAITTKDNNTFYFITEE